MVRKEMHFAHILKSVIASNLHDSSAVIGIMHAKQPDSFTNVSTLLGVQEIRRFGEVGIDDAVGMKMSGHKSIRIYHDYKAISQEDLKKASEKLSGASQRSPFYCYEGNIRARRRQHEEKESRRRRD